MPSKDERSIARAHDLHPERDLAAAAADFYLLETLCVRGDPKASAQLRELEAELAREFSIYLDMAIGGELRHATNYLEDEDIPDGLRVLLRNLSGARRGETWRTWFMVRSVVGLRALELAEEAFEAPGWRRNFGGKAWGSITRVLRLYLNSQISARIFVDQTFSLEHNSGSCFNKLYDTRALPRALVAHGCDDYASLAVLASKAVRRMWRAHQRQLRSEHDPIWLGVQSVEMAEDVA